MTNYDENINKAIDIINTTNGDYEEARRYLKDTLDSITPIIEPDIKFFSFVDFIEYFIFNSRFNKDGKYQIYEEPIYKIHYFMGISYLKEKDSEEAAKCFKEAIRWNPFDSRSYFELVDIYKLQNEYDNVKKTLFEAHKYLYKFKDLGIFYIELGDYAYLTKQYEIANIAYCYALFFKEDAYIDTMLLKIGGILKRAVVYYKKEECIQKLNELKIPTNIVKENMDELYNMYNYYKETKKDYGLYRELKENLYNLTENEIFEDDMKIKNNYFKFTFDVPEKWKILDKTEYNKTSTGSYTLYVLKVDSNTMINFDILKDAQTDLINEYQLFRNYIVKQGYRIDSENEIKTSNIKYIQMISQRKLLNEYINVIHNVFIMNNKLFDLTVPTFKNYNETNIKEAFNDENIIRLYKIINSIQFI